MNTVQLLKLSLINYFMYTVDSLGRSIILSQLKRSQTTTRSSKSQWIFRQCKKLVVTAVWWTYQCFPCNQQNCNSRHYLNRDQFLSDLNQIVENSITYNGPSSPYTRTAQTMRDVGLKSLEQVYIYIMQTVTLTKHYLLHIGCWCAESARDEAQCGRWVSCHTHLWPGG